MNQRRFILRHCPAAIASISILRYYLPLEMTARAIAERIETAGGPNSIDHRIASRLAAWRAERGWSLETLAQRTGISRASLSRLERCELSPTATMLSTLCGQYGCTLSRLMAEVENGPPSIVRAKEQVRWRDPETGYVRRILSPPHPNLKGELVEISLPRGSSVSYDVPPVPGLEHHLWMLEGDLSLEIAGTKFRLRKGDCVRYALLGPSRFVCVGRRPVRYLISMVRHD
jgi:transcriptional regulator with XRE-family HTH domain